MDKVKVKLTKWDRRQIYELLGIQELSQAPIYMIQDILDAREKLDESELEGDDDKLYTLTLKRNQFKEIYRIVTSDAVPWPVSKKVAELFHRLEDAKKRLEEENGD